MCYFDYEEALRAADWTHGNLVRYTRITDGKWFWMVFK